MVLSLAKQGTRRSRGRGFKLATTSRQVRGCNSRILFAVFHQCTKLKCRGGAIVAKEEQYGEGGWANTLIAELLLERGEGGREEGGTEGRRDSEVVRARVRAYVRVCDRGGGGGAAAELPNGDFWGGRGMPV